MLIPGCRIEIGLTAPFWKRVKNSSSRLKMLPNGVEQLNVLIEIRLELKVLNAFFGLDRDEAFFDRAVERSDMEEFL